MLWRHAEGYAFRKTQQENANEETAKGKAGDTVLERGDPYWPGDISWVRDSGCG